MSTSVSISAGLFSSPVLPQEISLANNNYHGYPCRETCHQVHHHCSKEVEDQLEFDLCLWYPSIKDNITCFSIEVTCPEPEAPSHGSVEVEGLLAGSEAQYDCHVFYDFNGDRVRTCQVRN